MHIFDELVRAWFDFFKRLDEEAFACALEEGAGLLLYWL